MKKQIQDDINTVIEEVHTKDTTLSIDLIKSFTSTSEELEELLETIFKTYKFDENEVNRDNFIGLSYMVTNALKELVLSNKEYKSTYVYKMSLVLDEALTKQITEPINSLIEYHLNNDKEDKLFALITAIKCLELEDEVKRLTLTKEQYNTWLETDLIHINTEQFEVLFGMPLRKQTELRSFRQDPLPSFQIDGKGKHYYNKEEVTKWLDNYRRQK